MISSLLMLSGLGLAAALPQFYDERKMGCEIPSMTFGPHAEAGDIVPVDTITFSIQDADGNIAMSWLPGEMYSVTVTAFGDAPVFAWIHSTLGTFAEPTTTCANAAYVGSPGAMPQAMHTFEWIAPAEAGAECAVVSTAQSSGPNVAYRTAMADFCPEGATAAAPGAAGPGGAPPPPPGSTPSSPAPDLGAGAGAGSPAGPEAGGDEPGGVAALLGCALAAPIALAAFVVM